MIILDASVLIAHLDENDGQHARARQVFDVVAGRELGASPLTLAEVFVGPARTGRLETAVGALGRLAVREIPLGPDGPSRLARLRAETGLKLPACCVLLAAQDADATVLTFDERLERAAGRLGLA